MKRDFDAVLKGYDGAPLLESGKEVKLGSPAVTVLLAQFQDEQSLRGEDKFSRYKLAERIGQGGVQDVSAEEIALLKSLIGKAYPPGIVGPAYEALEQDAPVAAAAVLAVAAED